MTDFSHSTRIAPPSHPIAALFMGSTIAAILTVGVSVASLVGSEDVGRLRELDLLRSLCLFLEDRLDIRVLSLLPVTLNQPFELHAPGSLILFIALSIPVTLSLFWVAAGVIAPLVVLAARRHRRRARDGSATWRWRPGYPLAVFAGFTLPAIWIALRHSWLFGSRATLWGAILAATLVVWLGLLATLRRPDRIRKFLRAGCMAGTAAALGVWISAGLVVAFEGQRPSQPEAASGLPNILLVSIDSLRRDHLHCYGYPRETSPTIDRIAADGAIFQTVVSPTSWTLPAHMTLLTALPPEVHGVVDDGMRLHNNALFLPQVLWRAGYTTAGFVSAPYLDAAYGFSQGFDHYDDYTVAKMSQGRSHQGITSPPLLGIVSQWLAQWDAGGRQRPFFVFMHMWDVHYDYTPPPPYDSMFDPDYRGTVTGENYEYGSQVYDGMDPRDLAHIIALYDGEIRFTDLYLGYVLDRLRALGVLDNTIVVVTADHGDEFFEHGHKSHSKALYDESVLVPLAIRYPPKVPSRRVVDGQVRLMDVAPTILALAGLARPAEFGAFGFADGYVAEDLSPWIVADANPDPPMLVAFGDLQTRYAPKPIASLRTPRFKLIESLGHARGGEELYDLRADPGERRNLGLQDTTAPLRDQLASWRESRPTDQRLAQKVELSQEHKEQLKALGYMQ